MSEFDIVFGVARKTVHRREEIVVNQFNTSRSQGLVHLLDSCGDARIELDLQIIDVAQLRRTNAEI